MQEKELEIAGGSLYYEKKADKIVITRLQGLAGEVTIPAMIEDLPVKAIDRKSFLSKKFLRKVSLPETIEEIGDWAFAYCDNLKKVSLPNRNISFGKSVFMECGQLFLLEVEEKDVQTAALLASAVTALEAYYLLHIPEAGTEEWLGKWDARLLTVLHTDDQEGYAKQVLCGEEDYGSTDLNAFVTGRRMEKVRLLFLRLLNPKGLPEKLRTELQEYLLLHTKGCESEETWQTVLKHHGNDQAYYKLFAELGCINEENFQGIISDIGEDFPEMKAYFLRYKEETMGHSDFFAALDLDF